MRNRRARRRLSRRATARSARGSSPSASSGASASRPGTTRRSRASARPTARLLIVGLAPGLRGANRTGRPFTGDYAGDLLYATLLKFGFARGHLSRRSRRRPDARRLRDRQRGRAACRRRTSRRRPRSTPAGNSWKRRLRHAPEPSGHRRARPHRARHDAARARREAVALSLRPRRGARRSGGSASTTAIHCSRYNTNTGRLTTAMFEAVFEKVLRVSRPA